MFDEGEYINEKFEESQVAGLMEKLFPEERGNHRVTNRDREQCCE